MFLERAQIHMKWFSCLGLAIRRSDFSFPFNRIWSHTWDITLGIVYIQITWFTIDEYKAVLEHKNKSAIEKAYLRLKSDVKHKKEYLEHLESQLQQYEIKINHD